MSWHKQLDSLSNIPAGNYEGYMWISNEKKPIKINQIDATQYEENNQPTNPFILEAFLYDNNTKTSVSVKHISGKYIIDLYNLNELNNDAETVDNFYIPNRLNENKLKFTEVWIPEKDSLCENFEVLKKQTVVFTGFEN